MPPQLFHLEGPSLKDLKAQAALRYGPRALIVSAELVTVGGIHGVLGRKHYEIVVEVPHDDGAGNTVPAPAGTAGAAPGKSRGRRRAASPEAAIDALLQQAELDEVRFAGGTDVPAAPRTPAGDAASAISTDSNLFAALMDNLTFATDPAGMNPAGSRRAASTPAAGQPATPIQPGPAVRSLPSAVVPPAAMPAVAVPPRVVSPSAGPAVFVAAEDGQFTDTTEHLGAESADPAGLPELGGPIMDVPAAGPPVPAVLRAAGDLVIVIGAPAVGWDVVHSMAAAFGGGHPAAIAVSGPAGRFPRDVRSISDRLGANAARAAGVDGGHAVFVAMTSSEVVSDGRFLLALRPDQVWLAVDAGRKEADTAAWVGAQTRSMERAGLQPAGLAVVGSGETSTPETVLTLGLPVGWLDGRPAGAATAARSTGAAGPTAGTATSRTAPRTTSASVPMPGAGGPSVVASAVVSPPGAVDPAQIVASVVVPTPAAGTAPAPGAVPAGGAADPSPGERDRRRSGSGRRRAEPAGIE
ncbi:hypothetical protein FQ377_10610 [Arthrobacter echini]|uniref:Uncharacterized protein n=1 Tax=Arthrobacter echini TaxID=1529066 RepID=A0A5D0XPH2_9MICC|nr:hypothetical protein [Arthrobacter echini]TYC98350.1 hypothetical protein FQ377_10610 [Arthrobacter echini]